MRVFPRSAQCGDMCTVLAGSVEEGDYGYCENHQVWWLARADRKRVGTSNDFLETPIYLTSISWDRVNAENVPHEIRIQV